MAAGEDWDPSPRTRQISAAEQERRGVEGETEWEADTGGGRRRAGEGEGEAEERRRRLRGSDPTNASAVGRARETVAAMRRIHIHNTSFVVGPQTRVGERTIKHVIKYLILSFTRIAHTRFRVPPRFRGKRD